MGHGSRGGRGASRKPPENNSKKQKNSTNTLKESTSESSDSDNSKKSHEDLSRAADLETVRAQAQHEVLDEIFQEDSTVQKVKKVSEKPNPESANRSDFLTAPGDNQCSHATTITKRQHQVKRRRHSLDEELEVENRLTVLCQSFSIVSTKVLKWVVKMSSHFLQLVFIQ